MPHVETRLGRWYCEEHGGNGSGERAVVLLHGLMLDRTTWRSLLPPLASQGRVVLLEGPGHGDSEVPPPFTLEEHAEALDDALEALGVERAVLVGHSWGGLVALRYALRRPRRTAGLVLIGASAAPERPARRLKYEAYLALIRLLGAPRWFVRLDVGGIVYGPRARRERPQLVDELHRTMNAHPRAGLVRAALAVIRRGSLEAELRRVEAPALLVCGRDDRTMEPRRSEALCRGIRGARLVVLDCGHTPQVERPGELAAAMLPFLRARLEPRRPERPPASGAEMPSLH